MNKVIKGGVLEKVELMVQTNSCTSQAKLYLGKDLWDKNSATSISMGDFLSRVQRGEYQDHFYRISAIQDKALRREEKKKGLPLVCISGAGGDRTNNGINEHSGFIGIDIDDCDPEQVKQRIKHDPYLYACFVSISNTGLCFIAKIDGEKHNESFLGLQQYFFEKYELSIDEQCGNIARARFVSYDPNLLYDENSKIFKHYPKKETAAETKVRTQPAVGVTADMETLILPQIEERGIDLVPSYSVWCKVAFSISNEYGAEGEEYFHRISAFGNYKEKQCRKQYQACLRSDIQRGAKEHITTINYFHKLCEANGIAIESEQTTAIKRSAFTQKKAGIPKAAAIASIHTILSISPENSTAIVNQVYDKDIFIDDVSDIDCIGEFLKANYSLRRNEISARLENNERELTNTDIHSIELAIKKKFPKTDYTTIDKILDSNFIVKYHPIFNFFAKYKNRGRPGTIDELFACIETNTGSEIRPDYAQYYGKKWMVGMIATLYQAVSPLMLILCGRDQGTGKTFFFENLLPEELKSYSTIKNLSSLNSDTFKRDMDIAISKYLLIYDDEMSGKSKRDQGAIKALLSTSSTSVRAAYARNEENRKRIATFGGTTNDLQILGDHTGNRRHIPIEVLSIDFERKDRIDPIDYIMEAFHLYHAGFNYKVLGKDMSDLNECTGQFNQVCLELDMVLKYYRKPATCSEGVYRSGSDIRNRLETSCRDKINANKLSAALNALGIEGERKRVAGIPSTWYKVFELSQCQQPDLDDDDRLK